MKNALRRSAVVKKNAEVAELVDAHDSKSCIERCVGSIPTFGTSKGPNCKVRAFLFPFRPLPEINQPVYKYQT